MNVSAFSAGARATWDIASCVVLWVHQEFPDPAGQCVLFRQPLDEEGDMAGNNFLRRGFLILG